MMLFTLILLSIFFKFVHVNENNVFIIDPFEIRRQCLLKFYNNNPAEQQKLTKGSKDDRKELKNNQLYVLDTCLQPKFCFLFKNDDSCELFALTPTQQESEIQLCSKSAAGEEDVKICYSRNYRDELDSKLKAIDDLMKSNVWNENVKKIIENYKSSNPNIKEFKTDDQIDFIIKRIMDEGDYFNFLRGGLKFCSNRFELGKCIVLSFLKNGNILRTQKIIPPVVQQARPANIKVSSSSTIIQQSKAPSQPKDKQNTKIASQVLSPTSDIRSKIKKIYEDLGILKYYSEDDDSSDVHNNDDDDHTIDYYDLDVGPIYESYHLHDND